jgi:hypothetical protein
MAMSRIVIDDDNEDSGLTRRTVLAGAAATAAASMAATGPANAQSLNPDSRQDMVLFVVLSAALTGIAEAKLAPEFNLQKLDPGSDPTNIKKDYFIWVNDRHPTAFESLLRLTESSQTAVDPAETIIAKLQFKDDEKRTRSEVEAKYLARSIALVWYLGAWYDPGDLEAASKDPDRTVNFKVISPKAYTQAWALRVAQAHPMGFSQMQFGYWHRDPNKLSIFVGKEVS